MNLFKGKTSEKIYKIDGHIYCAVSGVSADANYLVDYARYFFNLECQVSAIYTTLDNLCI